MHHLAVFNQSKSKNNFGEQLLHQKNNVLFPEFKGKKGALFGLSQVQRFIENEEKYDDYTLTKHEKDGNGHVRKLASFSSGQQKQLLLEHIRSQSQQLDFLILDNPYDCMDIAAQETFAKEFTELANKVQLIQVFKLRSEVLPLVQRFYAVEPQKIIFSGTAQEFDDYAEKQQELTNFKGSFPLPIHKIKIENPLVKFTDVNIFYQEKRQIVNNINWEINKGEFWHLKGPNGSGKTSLLTMITGDNPKAYGENIVLFGAKKGSGETVWELKEKIGYFSPSLVHNFNKLFTVQQMVLSGFYDSIGLYQKPTGIQIKETDKWLDLIGLKNKKQEYFVNLSSEMQRVVLIVRAMVKHPPLLILDEPTNELDDISTSILSTLICKIHQETETTILYVSHRTVLGLQPDKIFELIPTEKGSIGIEK